MNMQCIFIILISSSLLRLTTSYYDSCAYTDRSTQPDVYWINLDRSVDRGIKMNKTLNNVKLNGVRIRGIDAGKGEIYLPPDIEKTWPGAWCIKDLPATDENNPPVGTRAFLTGLCGRARKGVKGNTFGELGCTTSHLLAIREAVDRNHSSGIALISEDDIIFPFDIDYVALAASAPKDYGILQLFNSNPSSMMETWKRYHKNDQLWIDSHPNKRMDFWSTCIYLINLNVMRDVINAIAVYDNEGRLNMKVLAGVTSPCVPHACCNGHEFNHTPPCVYAPRGYQADSFIYATTKTYMLTVPLITAGKAGNESTMHQDHVGQFHRGAFLQQREYIAQMIKGMVKPPAFANPACAIEPGSLDK